MAAELAVKLAAKLAVKLAVKLAAKLAARLVVKLAGAAITAIKPAPRVLSSMLRECCAPVL